MAFWIVSLVWGGVHFDLLEWFLGVCVCVFAGVDRGGREVDSGGVRGDLILRAFSALVGVHQVTPVETRCFDLCHQ
jgi:hypothetical protein